MAGTADGEAFLAEFSGDERSVADYLVGEVLSTLPRDTVELPPGDQRVRRRFRWAWRARCRAGRTRAACWPSWSGSRGWSVRLGGTAAPGGYSRSLNTYLHADLNRSSPHRIARLHTIAARWWLEWGRPAKALEHAARSDDPRLLTTVVRQVAVPLLVAGDLGALQRALRASWRRRCRR